MKYLITVLERVLRDNGIPEEEYSLDGYADDSVCLEKMGTKWTVYNGSRGMKVNAKCCESLQDACKLIIKRVSEDIEEEQQLMNEFERNTSEIEVGISVKHEPKYGRVVKVKVSNASTFHRYKTMAGNATTPAFEWKKSIAKQSTKSEKGKAKSSESPLNKKLVKQ